MNKRQLLERINELEGVVENLRELAGFAYIFCGVHDAPEQWLDVMFAASFGADFTTDGLLPYTPSAQAGEVGESRRAESVWRRKRLGEIQRIIETVDNRAMANDGAVPSTMQEMTQREMSRIYGLARGVDCADLYTTPQPQGDASPEVSDGGDWYSAMVRHAMRMTASPDETCLDHEEYIEAVIDAAMSAPKAIPDERECCRRSRENYGEPCHEPAPTVDGGEDEAARRYIRDWCPDHVKDYIDRQTHPAPQADVARLVEALSELLQRMRGQLADSTADFAYVIVRDYCNELGDICKALAPFTKPEGATNGQG